MPHGGAGSPSVTYRARQLAQAARMIHERETDPRVGQWLGECEAQPELMDDPHSPQATNVREIRRDYDAAVKLPAQLVAQFSQAAAVSKHAWAQAKRANDFSHFRPHLEEMVRLCRAKAECWGFAAGGEPWDALADRHEPGMNARDLESLFVPLRKSLVEILNDAPDGGAYSDPLAGVHVPLDRQRAISRLVAERLGFDFSRGRCDESQHPFCLPLHRDDVRMTSRFREENLLDGLGSTMHEAGHGIYNQNLPGGELLDTPAAMPLRYAIHESQARLVENHVGRSRAFWRWGGEIVRRVSPALDHVRDDEFFASSNLVRRGLIRTESDELTYNLHILVRFDLERALIGGELQASDLPGAWAEKYRQYLGIDVPDDARGCMQDIHWSQGAIGYFPTYTLGNLYAAQFYAAAESAIADLDEQLSRGEFGPLMHWLCEQIHRHGRRYSPAELCRRATGADLSPQPLLSHLRRRFGPKAG